MKISNLQSRTNHAIAVFIVLSLVILYLFQIVFLDFSYEKYKINTIQKVAKEIKNYDSSIELSEYLEDAAYDQNMCIRYVVGDKSYNYNDKKSGCILQFSNKEVNQYINKLRSDKSIDYIKLITPDDIKIILYLVELDDDNYVILSTNLENLDDTIVLLREQLVYALIILVMVGLLFSYFLTKQINKPIYKIINSAKQLEKGNYDVKFEGSNIAELNELADVLTVATSEMKNTDELRRDLIANVSHDLKTPLTMIKAYAEKVRDLTYKDDEKRNKDLNVIISESDRLNGLVNDLLDVSKFESDANNLNVTEYDLIEQLNDVLKRYDIIQEEEGYSIELDIPDEEAIVKADRARIDQVFYNLINNAIEHTGEDKKVYIKIESKKNNYTVSIKDTGKGIKKEDIPLVWTKYYTKNKNHKRNVIGTGLGLSIVKNILEKHNFEYGIDTKVGEYTSFFFKINKSNKKEK